MPNRPDPNTVAVTFTLPKQLLERIEAKASSELTTKSRVIRRALMNYLTPAERRAVLQSLKRNRSVI